MESKDDFLFVLFLFFLFFLFFFFFIFVFTTSQSSLWISTGL